MRLLITDNGPHPADKWAEATADQIIDIGGQSAEPTLREAREFRKKVVEILTPHHDKVQKHERGKLQDKGHAHLETDLDPRAHLQSPVDKIIEAAAGTSFANHFMQERTRQYLEMVIGSHFATSMHIERLHHCDKHRAHPAVKAYRRKHGLEE